MEKGGEGEGKKKKKRRQKIKKEKKKEEEENEEGENRDGEREKRDGGGLAWDTYLLLHRKYWRLLLLHCRVGRRESWRPLLSRETLSFRVYFSPALFQRHLVLAGLSYRALECRGEQRASRSAAVGGIS